MCVDLTVFVVDLVVVTLRSRYKTVTRGSLRALVFFIVWMDFCWPLPPLELKQLRAFLCWLIFARQTARRTLNMSVLLTLCVCGRRSIRWNLSVSVLGV